MEFDQTGSASQDSMVWEETGTSLPNPSATAVANTSAAYWFIIYGPQTISGASSGPQGAQGAQGDNGSDGAQGPQGDNGSDGAQG